MDTYIIQQHCLLHCSWSSTSPVHVARGPNSVSMRGPARRLVAALAGALPQLPSLKKVENMHNKHDLGPSLRVPSDAH